MKCEQCEKTIGNTLYERGMKKLCPICYLGEEGRKPIYQQDDNPWTDEKLTILRDPPFKDKLEDAINWAWDDKNVKWTKKIV